MYSVEWEQLPFSDFTWLNVIKLVPKVVKCDFTWTYHSFNLDSNTTIERIPRNFTVRKTDRLPYTKDLIKCLILMVEFGAAKNLKHSDYDNKIFIDALDEVNMIHPLVSYNEQKNYFMGI